MFFPTITLDDAMLSRLEQGEVTLRTGQWVQIPGLLRRSRWVGSKEGGSLCILHNRTRTGLGFSNQVKRYRGFIS